MPGEHCDTENATGEHEDRRPGWAGADDPSARIVGADADECHRRERDCDSKSEHAESNECATTVNWTSHETQYHRHGAQVARGVHRA